MAKLWASCSIDKFRNFIFRIGFLSGLAGIGILLFFVLAGELVIDVTVGREFNEAYPVLLAYMTGYCIYMFGISFRPAILSIGHPERILLIHAISTVVYFVILVLLLDKVGIMGAAYAQIIFHSMSFIAMLSSLAQFIRKSVKANSLR
jgi:O-antigen/teichoic acid export membrane protein